MYLATAALFAFSFIACDKDEPTEEQKDDQNGTEQTDNKDENKDQDQSGDDTQAGVFNPACLQVWLGDGNWGDVTSGNYGLNIVEGDIAFSDNHAGDGNCWKTQLKINSDPQFNATAGQTLKISYTLTASNDVSVACCKVAQFPNGKDGEEGEICTPFQSENSEMNTTNQDGAAAIKLTADMDTNISFEKVLAEDCQNITLVFGFNGAQGTVYAISNISVTAE